MSFSVIVTAYDASILFQLSICHFCYYSSTHWMSSLIEFSFWDCHFLLPMMPLFCCNWAYVIFSASIQVKLSICNDDFFELSLLLNLAHCPILLSTTTTILLIYYSILLLLLATLLLLYAPTTCSLLLYYSLLYTTYYFLQLTTPTTYYSIQLTTYYNLLLLVLTVAGICNDDFFKCAKPVAFAMMIFF